MFNGIAMQQRLIVQFVAILCVCSVCNVCVYHSMREQTHCIQVLVGQMPQLGQSYSEGSLHHKAAALYTASACNGVSRGVVGG